MMQISETEAFRACRILFGRDLRLNREFLNYLQPRGARTAFRKRAKITHPDSAYARTHGQNNLLRQFQDLNQAHELVQNYLRQRDLLNARQRTATATHTTGPGKSGAQDSFRQTPKPGRLPTRPLQFGIYLYYRGRIPFSALIGALSWQRQQRPVFGQIAQHWGWLEQQDIEQILASNTLGRFGERAESLGLLSPIQTRAILLHQRTRQERLGRYFLEQNMLTTIELEQLLHDLSEHNLRYRHGYPNHFYYHR